MLKYFNKLFCESRSSGQKRKETPSGDRKLQKIDLGGIKSQVIQTDRHQTAFRYLLNLQQALSFSDRKIWLQAKERRKQRLTMDSNSIEAATLWNSMLQQKTKLLESQTEANAASRNLSSSERLQIAINRYRYQAQLYPDSAVVQTNLGKLYHKNRQWQEAISCYQKAIAIDSKYSPAHQYLSQIVNGLRP